MSPFRSVLNRVFSRLPGWMTPPVMAVAALLLVFTISVSMDPRPAVPAAEAANPILQSEIAQRPSQPRATRTPTSLPEEWLENHNQTDGVVFAGVILVLIVVVGTLTTISRKEHR